MIHVCFGVDPFVFTEFFDGFWTCLIKFASFFFFLGGGVFIKDFFFCLGFAYGMIVEVSLFFSISVFDC